MLRSGFSAARTLMAAAALCVVGFGTAVAQEASPVGDWEGSLDTPAGSLPLVLHVTADEEGALGATLDSPAQNAYGIQGADVTFEDGALTIAFPEVSGSYEATLSEDGDALTGTWSQMGQSLGLDLTRQEG